VAKWSFSLGSGGRGVGTSRARDDSMGSTKLDDLRRAAATCTSCELYKHATQTVFGEGAARAEMVLVGEQPGHEEDLAGQPFVGPAGRLLDEALSKAGLDRRRLYITNAVKHFKWTKDKGGGKRRIHDKPNRDEIEACRPWLQQELWLIQPEVVVCLGVTAANAVLRKRVTISASRGESLTSPEGYRTCVTVHPSAILRIPDHKNREAEMQRFVHDLQRAARAR
jgi:uracil-DNA glycosylase